jgi:hypothetical protein
MSPLQELAATEPVLGLQALPGGVQLDAGGPAFTIPAAPTITRIPPRAATTSDLRLFMIVLPSTLSIGEDFKSRATGL